VLSGQCLSRRVPEPPSRHVRDRRPHTDRKDDGPPTGDEKALRHLHPDQLVLHPDCGFAPSSMLPIPLDEAYFKLRALGLAADRLRQRYG
jgi:hypothetical protein